MSGTTTDTTTDLLQIDNLGKRFGGFVALDKISIAVRGGERLGLIGPNGSGKSTLVNCICGTLQNEQGSVRFAGRRLDGATAHQRTRLGLSRTLSIAAAVREPFFARQHAHSAALHRGGARAAPTSTTSRGAASTCSARSASTPRRGTCRATSPRSRCASSNSRAPWRRSRSS